MSAMGIGMVLIMCTEVPPMSGECDLHLNPQQYSVLIRIWKTEYSEGL